MAETDFNPTAPGDVTDTNLAPAPFQGLEHYSEDRRAYFAGRENDIRIITANVATSRLTVLYGASGVGKSSILLAGVLPELRSFPATIPVVIRDWQTASFETLMRDAIAVEAERASGRPLDDVRGTLAELVVRVATQCGGEVILIFDQFEEYFRSRADRVTRKRFEQELAATINREEVPAHVLFSLREDSLSLLDRFEARIPYVLGNTIRLTHLDRDAGGRAIREPLKTFSKLHYAVSIEEQLVERLLHECSTGHLDLGPLTSLRDVKAPVEGAPTLGSSAGIELPVLQLILTRLWEASDPRSTGALRTATLDDLGGVPKIVSSHLDNVLNGFSPSQKRVLASIFDRLVTPTGGKIAYTQADLEAITRDYDPKLAPLVGRVLSDLSSPAVRVLRVLPPPPGEPIDRQRFELLHDVLGLAVRDWRQRFVEAETLKRSRRRAAIVGGSVLGVIVVALAVAIFRNYTLWLETRPWATMTSLSSGQVYPLTQSAAIIGRKTAATEDLQFQIPLIPRSISRFHLAISNRHTAVDMRSRFGTTINAEFLRYAESRQLNDRDIIALAGTIAFRYAPLEYRPGSFLRSPPIKPGKIPEGWAVLIDGVRRKISILKDSAYFIAVKEDGGVELVKSKQDGAVFRIRRYHEAKRFGYEFQEISVRFFESRGDLCNEKNDGILLGLLRDPAVSRRVFESRQGLITLTPLLENDELSAEVKKGDYCYGRFPLTRSNTEIFDVFDPHINEAHSLTELIYRTKRAAFQIVPILEGVERRPSQQ